MPQDLGGGEVPAIGFRSPEFKERFKSSGAFAPVLGSERGVRS